MPFNAFLDLDIVSLEEKKVCLKLGMKAEFVGNYFRGPNLHGGVIASILDTAGGMSASYNLFKNAAHVSVEKLTEKFSKGGTIDLRIDFLRPGSGKFFLATASILRLGRRMAVTRMELKNDKETLVAVGTGTYLVG